jgi:hypothetical protein
MPRKGLKWKLRSNCSGKPGFAQQNAPKKQKGKPEIKTNTAYSRVCKPPFSNPKARSKAIFGYAAA